MHKKGIIIPLKKNIPISAIIKFVWHGYYITVYFENQVFYVSIIKNIMKNFFEKSINFRLTIS